MKSEVRAGALTAILENGFLRQIRCGRRLVLSRVYVAVRDRNWGTLPARLSNIQQVIEERSFRVSYDAEWQQAEIRFAARICIEGAETGSIRWTLDGKALSTFMKNRIGFCVLHDMSCAGEPCEVEHSDGSRESGRFPLRVSPHQPFFDVSAIRHEVAEGVSAEVRFEGDVFEMEDQRNWTDGSFKTYSTPLRIPYPAEMKEGAEIHQAVTLSLHGAAAQEPAVEPAGPVVLAVREDAKTPVPAIGLCLGRDGLRPDGIILERLKPLKLSHLRAEIDFRRKGAETSLSIAARASNAARLPLEVALLLTRDGEEEMRSIAKAARAWKLNVCRWCILPVTERATTAEWLAAARRALGGAVPIVAGTAGNFADLNRNRPDPTFADGFCFSANPQVHATDDSTLADNALGAGAAAASAAEFAGGLPIHVSPISLLPRSAPHPDPRQQTWITAVWSLMSLKSLASAGAASVTLFEIAGPRGVMAERGEEVYPVWHALRDVAGFADGEVLGLTADLPPGLTADLPPGLKADLPPGIDALALRLGRRTRLLIASFAEHPCDVRLKCKGLGRFKSAQSVDEQARVADLAAQVEDMNLPLTVPPRGWLRVDFELTGQDEH